jgi:hypothetical protein
VGIGDEGVDRSVVHGARADALRGWRDIWIALVALGIVGAWAVYRDAEDDTPPVPLDVASGAGGERERRHEVTVPLSRIEMGSSAAPMGFVTAQGPHPHGGCPGDRTRHGDEVEYGDHRESCSGSTEAQTHEALSP